ncbi:Uncharacterized protein LACOL_0665 [Paucilactobacillus oligofermentans DSM 15707 = LMG 22743]|nr:hypothetical protein [Paucilactobacillus oligofermentans]CUS25973.1 Uncharacterized protein LACOL_0665 [Paucilactobacillus oligofermentans DSM 15707 = LMG 22743]
MKKFIKLLAISSVVLGLSGLMFGIMTLGHALVLTIAGTILLILEVGGLTITCLIFDSIVTLLSLFNILIYKLFVHEHKTPQEAK